MRDLKQGIIVGTWSGGLKYADVCLDSLAPIKDKYPITIIVNDFKQTEEMEDWIVSKDEYDTILIPRDSYELGAIKVARDMAGYDEFWFFQDTVEITDTSFIESSFIDLPGYSVTYCTNYMQYYLGKYRTKTLKKVSIPTVTTKQEAIDWEWKFTAPYIKADGHPGFIVDSSFDGQFPTNSPKNYLEEFLGEERFVVIGKYLKKRLSLQVANGLPIHDLERWKDSWRRK